MTNYTDNDRDIIKALAFLSLLYPRFQLSEETIAAYIRVLRDLPSGLVEQAALDIGSRSTWFPAAAEIRTVAFELITKQQGIPTPHEAWGEVMGSFSRGDSKFSHPLIGQALTSLGGKQLLGQSEDIISDRVQFIASYKALVSREAHNVRTLPGVREYAEQLDAGQTLGEIKRLAGQLKLANGRKA